MKMMVGQQCRWQGRVVVYLGPVSGEPGMANVQDGGEVVEAWKIDLRPLQKQITIKSPPTRKGKAPPIYGGKNGVTNFSSYGTALDILGRSKGGMGYAPMYNAFYGNLPHYQRDVLCFILNHAYMLGEIVFNHKHGWFYCSNRFIADRCDISIDTVKRCVKELTARGFLSWKMEYGSKKGKEGKKKGDNHRMLFIHNDVLINFANEAKNKIKEEQEQDDD